MSESASKTYAEYAAASIADIRKRMGLTEQRFGELLGCQKPRLAVELYEKGLRVPSAQTVALLDVLQTVLEALDALDGGDADHARNLLRRMAGR
jgi:DNA-binding transcriptional regulator YiaG